MKNIMALAVGSSDGAGFGDNTKALVMTRGIAEMARFGVVSLSDMYYATDERVAAVTEAGMKMNVCESELFFEPKPFAEYAVCAKMERFVQQYHGADDGRIRVDYNIHAEYTLSLIHI